MTPAAFYCVCSDVYFLGAVGMINSLRLVGHDEPLYVLDFGLRPEQRDLLEAQATIVAPPAGLTPHLAKTVAPLAHPAEVMTLIDADMIVTRRLDALVDTASGGRVVAVKDNLDRFHPEWAELLGVGPARPGPYVSSGLVVLGGEEGHEVLRLLERGQRSADFELEVDINRKNPPPHPYRYLEQDVLNAVLRTWLPAERLETLPRGLAPTPPFHGIRPTGETPVHCRSRDGAEPYVLHQFVRKPWLERMYWSPYSMLLARCLLGEGLAIRVPEAGVPPWLRPGIAPHLGRLATNVYDGLRWTLVDFLPDRVAARRRGGPPA